jgi:ribose transport system substrate-binding protein
VIASAVSGARSEAKVKHIQIKFGLAPDAPSQQSAIDQLIGLGVNVLAIDPNDSTAITTSVKAANSKKIPVIMWVGKATGGNVATFIGSDELQGGKNVAKYLAKALRGRGEVALINGDEVHQAFILREKGFRTQLKKYPGLKLVAFGLGKETAPPSESLARDMMTAHPNLKAIVALSDAMAAGVYQAVRALHKTSGVAVVGYNGDCPTLRSIWQGQIHATVFQNWYGFGADVVNAAIALHAGKKLPAKMIEPTVVIDRKLMQAVHGGTYRSKDPSLKASVEEAVTNHCPKA